MDHFPKKKNVDYPKRKGLNYNHQVGFRIDDELNELMKYAKDHGYDPKENGRIAMKLWFQDLKEKIDNEDQQAS